MNENDTAWVALNLVPGLQPARAIRLAEALGGADGVFRADPARLRAIGGLSPETVHNIVTFPWRSKANDEIRQSNNRKFHILTYASDLYPARLRNIPDPPPVLYVHGELLPGDDLCVGVVGSRSPSPYGLGAAADLGRDLARRGVTVVSGMAKGADSAAHQGALDGGGRTVAVLGSGLDVPYPRRNRRLMERIARQGAAVSEFPLGTRPVPWNFPRRNRVIAGMTLGTVVIEAAARSGSLITAELALEGGREVFAVPGRVTSPRSEGTNSLIRDGARLARSAADVIDDLPAEWRERARPEPRSLDPRLVAGLDEGETRVLAQLGPDEPTLVDALARDVGLPHGRLLDALLSLEMRRLVRAVPGGRYMRTSEARGK
jgi:DNA processing protein